MKIAIDIVSDVVCPWCYLGKRRLERAIAAAGDQAEFEVRWHPFELNPQMPPEGMEREIYRRIKFGSLERSRELDSRMTYLGREEGIPFALDRLERTPNTLDAHRLIRFAGTAGCEDATVEALFKAYFCEGVDLTDRKDLLEIGTAAGLDRGNLAAHLDSPAGVAEIRAAEEQARQRRIEGVPHFTVAGRFELSGAQQPEAFLDVFERVRRGEDASPSPTNTRFVRR